MQEALLPAVPPVLLLPAPAAAHRRLGGRRPLCAAHQGQSVGPLPSCCFHRGLRCRRFRAVPLHTTLHAPAPPAVRCHAPEIRPSPGLPAPHTPALPWLQMGIVGEMRETGTKLADSLASVGERLGVGGAKKE